MGNSNERAVSSRTSINPVPVSSNLNEENSRENPKVGNFYCDCGLAQPAHSYFSADLASVVAAYSTGANALLENGNARIIGGSPLALVRPLAFARDGNRIARGRAVRRICHHCGGGVRQFVSPPVLGPFERRDVNSSVLQGVSNAAGDLNSARCIAVNANGIRAHLYRLAGD